MFGERTRRREAQEQVRAHFAARAERQRLLGERAAAWCADGEVTPERVASEYQARLAALDPDTAAIAPFAAAFEFALPSDGLLQVFAGEGGGELARYIPADDLGPQRECTVSDDLAGYSFGWWPMSRPEDPDALTFLAVCNSNADLGLRYSDEGFLWATVPTIELAAGDFTHLHCEGESS